MIETIRVFVGFDAREASAYHVCCQSIIDHASRPVSFTPIKLSHLSGYEETHKDGSNDFIYSRFLVPFLCNYEGWAIFVDGDMIVNDDIAKLWDMRNPWQAVQVVQHDYQTKYPKKYLGAKNESYPRKNWSSVILFNCGHYANRKLTPDYVEAASGAMLHRFEWLPDNRIGELPKEWNHLTMEYPARDDASLYHYTVGTSCFPEYADEPEAKYWWDALGRAIAPLRCDKNVMLGREHAEAVS